MRSRERKDLEEWEVVITLVLNIRSKLLGFKWKSKNQNIGEEAQRVDTNALPPDHAINHKLYQKGRPQAHSQKRIRCLPSKHKMEADSTKVELDKKRLEGQREEVSFKCWFKNP